MSWKFAVGCPCCETESSSSNSSSNSSNGCCPPDKTDAECCCYLPFCLSLVMTYQGQSHCLTGGNSLPCQWSGGGFTLSWCYNTQTWTLQGASGKLGSVSAACSFPLSIATSSGTASIFTMCGWTDWPTTATVTIGGVPDPYQFYMPPPCPSAPPYFSGTGVCNGTFVLDLGAILNAPCSWGYSEQVIIQGCDYPGSARVPCPGADCGDVNCQFNVTLLLRCFSGSGFQGVITFSLVNSSLGGILGDQQTFFIPAAKTCVWPQSPPMPATMQALRFGPFSSPSVSISIP